ncbi:MAG: PqqD family protein [Vicinamibacterales bacterium]
MTINPHEHVAASVHDRGVVLLHTIDGRLFASNHTGARIWQALERRLPVEAIAAEISDHYGVSRDTAAADTAQFIIELEQRRLVRRGVGR